MTQIPAPEIRGELDRILASKGFAGAGRISKLLRYVVDKTLAGETDQLKEYSVGVEVFDRDGKYDPRLDSIVRVEAGRLRSRLDDYYHGEGAASPIRIRLPKGGYVAQFDRPADEAAREVAPVGRLAEHRKRSRAAIPLAVGLICAVAAMVVWLGGWNRRPAEDQRPVIAVLPFESNVAGNDHPDLSRRMTEAVTSELARLGTVGVVSYTSAMQFARPHGPIREIASTLNANFIVEASIDDEASHMLIVARIVNAGTDRKMWVSDYRGGFDDVRGIAQRMAFDISAAVLKAPQAPWAP